MRGQPERALSSIAVPPPVENSRPLLQRVRERFGTRAVAIALALLIELLLALLLLTLAPKILTPPEETVPMATFGVSPEPESAPEPPSEARPADAVAQPTERAQPRDAETPPTPDPVVADPAPEPPVLLDIPLSRMPDIATLPRRPAAGPAAPARRVAGPPAPGPDPGDSRRVEGRGPNGEPLYAASWFREP
jgi:protein TonB